MTTMASSTAFCISFKLSPSSSSSSTATRSSFRSPLSTVHFSQFTNKTSLTLTSSHTLSGFAPLLPQRIPTVASPTRNPPPLTVVCAKGYKMKTHKASAKRFRVTGSGKIMRRKCGKQHLLGKKNAKRRNRLSKSVRAPNSFTLCKLKGFVCWNALGKPTSFGLYEALLVRDEAWFGLVKKRTVAGSCLFPSSCNLLFLNLGFSLLLQVQVHRSDYNNVIGALPYLKVNRKN
ncbi:hypothetical protein C3L33_03798, partial [Rhododendron williamsianum]